VGTIDEATRLEQLWNGEFGDQYVARNATAGGGRGPFWAWHASRFPAARVLEIGCNVGANLRHFADLTESNGLWGVDVNEIALTRAREALPSVNIGWGVARELPFRDGFFDLTLSVAVLIHQPNETIADSIDELVRCSRRFVTVIEYTAPEVIEVNYRDQSGAFFKRPFGELIAARHPDLELTHRQNVTKADGFDDGMECFVFAKP
jgi:pseudaminic acid biosynthesis-associated methylase